MIYCSLITNSGTQAWNNESLGTGSGIQVYATAKCKTACLFKTLNYWIKSTGVPYLMMFIPIGLKIAANSKVKRTSPVSHLWTALSKREIPRNRNITISLTMLQAGRKETTSVRKNKTSVHKNIHMIYSIHTLFWPTNTLDSNISETAQLHNYKYS